MGRRRATARLAARDHRPEDLPRIHARQMDFAEAVKARDALAMIASNRDFHLSIAEAGRNPYYTSLFARLLDEGRRILRFYYRSFDDQLPRAYVEEHEAIIAAIEASDMDDADTLSAAHADQIVIQIRQLIAADRRDSLEL